MGRRGENCRPATAKKQNRFSKGVVFSVIVLNSAFTASVLYIYLHIGSEPTALIAAWFGFTTGELWLLSGIKKKKIKEENTDVRETY